jgi:hypothetical protein
LLVMVRRRARVVRVSMMLAMVSLARLVEAKGVELRRQGSDLAEITSR